MPANAWWRSVAIDAVVVTTGAAVLVLGSVRAAGGQVPPRHPWDALGFAILLTVALAFAARRRWPTGVLAFCVAASIALLVLRYPYGPILLASGVAMFLVALARPLRWSVGACCLGTVAIVSVEAAITMRSNQSIVATLLLMAWTGWLLLPWAMGALLRHRMEAAKSARVEERRHRLYEERLLMARQVHDIVAHGLAVISMQAGVALHVLERRPEQAKVALEAIRDTSRLSLEELRITMTMFRPTAGFEDWRTTAGMAQLDSLVATAAGSGVTVTAEIVGTPRTLPVFVDIAAYRIAQESLTNVLRHSGATTATIRFEYCADAVELQVTDNGRAAPGQAPPPRGHGLDGMAERVAAIGGILEAHPHDRGGWQVRARLPLGDQTR